MYASNHFNFIIGLNSYLITFSISIIIGSLFYYLGRNHSKDISLTDQITFILLSFFLIPVLISIPYLLSIYKLGFNSNIYLERTWEILEPLDVISGLVKASVFVFIISLMGCFHGYHSRGGAQGVGASTTNAVVSASVLILAFNYIITELFFAI